MSKSRGTFIKARTYLDNLDPSYLRYYYAAKLGPTIEDIDRLGGFELPYYNSPTTPPSLDRLPIDELERRAAPQSGASEWRDGYRKMIDYAPLDVHVGSIAVRRFIESRAPYLTLHGHVH